MSRISGSGDGVFAAEGAIVDIADARLSRNRLIGAGVLSSASRLLLARTVIDGTRSIDDGEFCFGLFAGEGGPLDGRWLRVTGNHAAGAVVDSPAGRMDLAHVVVDHTQGRTKDQRGGFGLVALHGAQGTVRHGTIRDNRTVGALAHGPGSTWTVSASVVRDTDSGTDTPGYGLLAADGGRVRLFGGRASGNHVAGLACMAQSASTAATWAYTAGSILEANAVDAKTGAWGMGAIASGPAAASTLRRPWCATASSSAPWPRPTCTPPCQARNQSPSSLPMAWSRARRR